MPGPFSVDESAIELSADELLLELQRITAELDQAECAHHSDDIARLKMARNRLAVTLMERYGERFRRYCLGRLRLSADDADDVTQEAFIKILRSISQFDRERGTAESWLFTVLRHLGLDLLRRRRHELPVTDEWLLAIEHVTDDDFAELIEDEVSPKWSLSVIQCLVTTIDEISDEDRALLKAGPPKRGPASKALKAAWLRLRISLADCLAVNEDVEKGRG